MNYIYNQLLEFNMDITWAGYLSLIIMVLFILLVCIIANFISKKVVIRVITKIVQNTKFRWDDMLLERKVFHRLSHIVPAIIIYFFCFRLPESFKNLSKRLQ